MVLDTRLENPDCAGLNRMLAEKFVFYSSGSRCLSKAFVMPPELCLRKIRLTLAC